MKPSEDRPLPFNIEAEEAVLGACLMDPDAIRLIRGLLKPHSFYREIHGWLWEALCALDDDGMPADIVSACEALERRGRLKEVGGPAFVAGLTLKVPTAMHAEHYARIVRRHARERRAIQQAERLARAAYGGTTSEEELVTVAYEAANEIAMEAPLREPRPAADVARAAYERFERRYHGDEPAGIPTASKDLTRLTGGFKPGTLVIVAGRPGMGKTSFALANLKAAAAAGTRGLIFSLEMSSEDLFDRLASTEGRIDLARIRDGLCSEHEFETVSEAYSTLATLPVAADDASGLTPEHARATIARHIARHPDLAFVVVDYAQRMDAGERGRRMERYQQLGEVSRQLKAIAREYDLCVMLLAQVGREVERRASKRPMLSDLRESGDLEADADAVMFLYREEVYDGNTTRPNVCEIIVAKHRNGALGLIEMHFAKEYGAWYDLAAYDERELPRMLTVLPSSRNGHSDRHWTDDVEF